MPVIYSHVNPQAQSGDNAETWLVKLLARGVQNIGRGVITPVKGAAVATIDSLQSNKENTHKAIVRHLGTLEQQKALQDQEREEANAKQDSVMDTIQFAMDHPDMGTLGIDKAKLIASGRSPYVKTIPTPGAKVAAAFDMLTNGQTFDPEAWSRAWQLGEAPRQADETGWSQPRNTAEGIADIGIPLVYDILTGKALMKNPASALQGAAKVGGLFGLRSGLSAYGADRSDDSFTSQGAFNHAITQSSVDAAVASIFGLGQMGAGPLGRLAGRAGLSPAVARVAGSQGLNALAAAGQTALQGRADQYLHPETPLWSTGSFLKNYGLMAGLGLLHPALESQHRKMMAPAAELHPNPTDVGIANTNSFRDIEQLHRALQSRTMAERLYQQNWVEKMRQTFSPEDLSQLQDYMDWKNVVQQGSKAPMPSGINPEAMEAILQHPLFQENHQRLQAMHAETQGLKGRNVPDPNAYYLPRVLVESGVTQPNPNPQAKGQTAVVPTRYNAELPRNMMALESPTGERIMVARNGGKATWYNGLTGGIMGTFSRTSLGAEATPYLLKMADSFKRMGDALRAAGIKNPVTDFGLDANIPAQLGESYRNLTQLGESINQKSTELQKANQDLANLMRQHGEASAFTEELRHDAASKDPSITPWTRKMEALKAEASGIANEHAKLSEALNSLDAYEMTPGERSAMESKRDLLATRFNELQARVESIADSTNSRILNKKSAIDSKHQAAMSKLESEILKRSDEVAKLQENVDADMNWHDRLLEEHDAKVADFVKLIGEMRKATFGIKGQQDPGSVASVLTGSGPIPEDLVSGGRPGEAAHDNAKLDWDQAAKALFDLQRDAGVVSEGGNTFANWRSVPAWKLNVKGMSKLWQMTDATTRELHEQLPALQYRKDPLLNLAETSVSAYRGLLGTKWQQEFLNNPNFVQPKGDRLDMSGKVYVPVDEEVGRRMPWLADRQVHPEANNFFKSLITEGNAAYQDSLLGKLNDLYRDLSFANPLIHGHNMFPHMALAMGGLKGNPSDILNAIEMGWGAVHENNAIMQNHLQGGGVVMNRKGLQRSWSDMFKGQENFNQRRAETLTPAGENVPDNSPINRADLSDYEGFRDLVARTGSVGKALLQLPQMGIRSMNKNVTWAVDDAFRIGSEVKWLIDHGFDPNTPGEHWRQAVQEVGKIYPNYQAPIYTADITTNGGDQGAKGAFNKGMRALTDEDLTKWGNPLMFMRYRKGAAMGLANELGVPDLLTRGNRLEGLAKLGVGATTLAALYGATHALGDPIVRTLTHNDATQYAGGGPLTIGGHIGSIVTNPTDLGNALDQTSKEFTLSPLPNAFLQAIKTVGTDPAYRTELGNTVSALRNGEWQSAKEYGGNLLNEDLKALLSPLMMGQQAKEVASGKQDPGEAFFNQLLRGVKDKTAAERRLSALVPSTLTPIDTRLDANTRKENATAIAEALRNGHFGTLDEMMDEGKVDPKDYDKMIDQLLLPREQALGHRLMKFQLDTIQPVAREMNEKEFDAAWATIITKIDRAVASGKHLNASIDLLHEAINRMKKGWRPETEETVQDLEEYIKDIKEMKNTGTSE